MCVCVHAPMYDTMDQTKYPCMHFPFAIFSLGIRISESVWKTVIMALSGSVDLHVNLLMSVLSMPLKR